MPEVSIRILDGFCFFLDNILSLMSGLEIIKLLTCPSIVHTG